jgi:tRNA modification GTPase
MGNLSDTIAALSTPVGTSALAVVRASGPLCVEIHQALFGSSPTPRLAKHGDYTACSGTVLDDVVVTYFAGPHSYSGEDTLEISCHGNPFVAQAILEDLFQRGCRSAEPGEFTRRAFLNGRLDLSQAEAVADLIHARSERALAAANQQLRGSLGRHLNVLIEELLASLARVEAYIDFPDEDLPAEDRSQVRQAIARTLAGAERLLATQHYGAMLRDGIKTVILGEPNAGKSSLLNRLVGSERALVSPEPGTTRDYIEERIALGPHGIRLIDTAGLNETPAPLERLGMDKTVERAAEADLFLWVLDATRSVPPLPETVRARLGPENTIVVLNKVDLAPHAAMPTSLPTPHVVRTSALDGEGVDRLVAEIVRAAESYRVHQGDELIAINARHADALGRAQDALRASLAKLVRNEPVELLASDLRGALDAFGEIGGRVDNERMLDHLFATFCIGK